MSQLRLSNTNWGERKLNVMAFSSPVGGWIESAQARRLIHHFPIKALQPELELEVMFRSEEEYEDFQIWVRNVQIDTQTNAFAPGVTIWWPQRSIYNWTGVIKAFRAGGRRFDYTPRAKFTIDLIDSMVSSRTTLSSLGNDFSEISGINTPGGMLEQGSLADTLIVPPAPVDTPPVSEEPTDNLMDLPPIIMPSIEGSGGGGGAGGGQGGGGSL